MKKAMLSQPMAGKSDSEIVATRDKAIKTLEEKSYEIVNTLFTDDWYKKEQMEGRGVVQIPLCFLAKSLENMSLCHAAYFCKGWELTRGCKIEHAAAVAYGLEVLYEEQSMINAVMCSGLCNSDSDDYCGMYLEGEECPACAVIKKESLEGCDTNG